MSEEITDEQVGQDEDSGDGMSAGQETPDSLAGSLQAERDELKDLLLRKQAEFENFRKRTERERSEFVQFALADCFREILNVLDSFELALRDRGVGDQASRDVHRGYELIYKQLLESLQRFGLEAIDAAGMVFDPHVHQAVSTEPRDGVEEGVVLDDLRRGYLLKGKLLRPAMVTVAAAPEASGDENS